MKYRNLTLVFNHFEQEHLGKDVFLVPYYIGKLLNYDVTIVYRATETNRIFPQYIKGVKLVPLEVVDDDKVPIYKQNINNLRYIVKNARRIDILMCFHHDPLTEIRVCLYKLFNPKGKAYVKLDLEELIERRAHLGRRDRWLWNWIKRTFLKKVDLLSCETTRIFNQLRESNLPHYSYNDKLLLMPNGFDEELMKSYCIQENEFNNKENIFITVGRLGCEQKNTEMILDALKLVEMRDWKFYLIGPIEDSLKIIIDSFYESFPDKRDSVKFLGPIYNKKDLWEYYNRAKVFVFTSRYESYGLVLNEAKRFRNYILSTNVGAYSDITENEKYGTSLIQEDSSDLAEKMQRIIDGNFNIDVYKDFNPINISWEMQIQKFTTKIKDFL